MAQIVVETGFEASKVEVPSVERISVPNGYHDLRERFKDLFAYESVGRWLRKKQPRTMAQYLTLMEKFFRWSGLRTNVSNPVELLAWAKAREGTEVQDLIDEYTEGSSVSKSQINTALLRSFLARNGYNLLPKIDWASTMNFSEGYSRAEIISLLGYLDSPFQKLYVHAGKDSGLRANDLLSMTYGQIRQDFEADQRFVHVRFPKEAYLRRKAPGRTFLGPNSLEILQKLVKEGKVKTEPSTRIFPFTYSTITGSLSWARKQAGLRDDIQPSHGLRKFFENALDRVGMDHHKKNQLEGHSNGVRAAYTSRDLEELRGLYEKAYEYLDLSEEAASSSEVRELKRTVKELKDELEKKDKLIPQLIARIEKVEKDLGREAGS